MTHPKRYVWHVPIVVIKDERVIKARLRIEGIRKMWGYLEYNGKDYFSGEPYSHYYNLRDWAKAKLKRIVD